MTTRFDFKTKEQALAFAATVEKRWNLLTNTSTHQHIPNPHAIVPDTDKGVEVERASMETESAIIALAEKEFGGVFIST